jgi:hypothetical protein
MRPIGRRVFASGAGSAAALAAVPGWARPLPPVPTLPLAFSVATEGGRAVREAPWIDAQLAEVERLFEPVGLRFRKTQQHILSARFARLETRQDRDALDEARVPSLVNVFVVASLRDVDDTRMYRMGVHWRHTTTPAHRWVIVTVDALQSTLAHELGHWLGLPHTQTVDNLMSYNRTGDRVFVTKHQGATMRAFARIALAAGEVLPVSDA